MKRRQLCYPLAVRAGRRRPCAEAPRRGGLTIVEMLVAMSITLLIMAAVVTVFANISASVTRRRATIEMSSALRNVRETLARDLAGATCPAVPWQRPESNVGYLEIIEGPQNDYYPTPWLFDGDGDGEPNPIGTTARSTPGIDLSVSSLPGSDLGGDPINDIEGQGLMVGSLAPTSETLPTDGRGLGDADDILMFTVRNESEPFVGRIPLRGATGATPSNAAFNAWTYEEVESPLAEVVWFAVENPVDANRTFAFGEAGYRTIHRRALLIMPDLEYRITVPTPTGGPTLSAPGVVRVLGDGVERNQTSRALAALIAFQDRYDLSVRLEWDPLIGADGRWVLVANTLGDLTKRENRYEHHGFVTQPSTIWIRHGAASNRADRFFPFAVASGGIYSGEETPAVAFVPDPELPATAAGGISAYVAPGGYVTAFHGAGANPGSYPARPLAVVMSQTDAPATARAILDETGRVVHLTTGLAPLGGSRRGEDVMMTDALAFDLRVYDPGAPTYGYYLGGNTNAAADQIIEPGDPAWASAYFQDTRNNSPPGDGVSPMLFARQGAYVDLAYGLSFINPGVSPTQIADRFGRTNLANTWDLAVAAGMKRALFFNDGLPRVASGPNNLAPLGPNALSQRYAIYDTWSWHYETNGVNEDGDTPEGTIRTAAGDRAATDEATNGLDEPTLYHDDTNNDGLKGPGEYQLATRQGPDDYDERETRPPYDTALRGMQATLRVYERDSRQIREVRVRESFVPE